MCGIAGIACLGGDPRPLPEALAAMCNTLVHRGPDEEGREVRAGVALGMRRLSIIDLAGEVHDTLEIPDAGPFRAIAYLEDQDALVLTEEWQTVVSESTRYAVWTYDFRNTNMIRLVKDQFLGSHVVYSPN